MPYRSTAENLLMAVLECSTDGIVLLDSDGRIREWSEGASRIWGHSREEAMGTDAKDLTDGLLGLAADPEAIGAREATVQRRSDGAAVHVLVRTHALRDGGGGSVGTVAVVRDVTELERGHVTIQDREQELSEALRALRKSHRELKSTQLQLIQAAKLESIGRLAAGVAHEVKNPLAILLTGVQLLQRRQASNDVATAELLSDLVVAIKRANDVVRGLLDFAASIELQREMVDLDAVVSGVEALLRHEIQKRRVQFTFERQAPMPALRLDRTKIEQVLMNLMMNALDAMKEGGRLTVRTSMRQLTQQGHGVGFRSSDVLRVGQTVAVVEVEDNGSGIPEEALAKVFEPFYTTKTAGKGTGLGLAVCRTIAGLHHGLIWLENRSEGGTRATLWLPAGESEKGIPS